MVKESSILTALLCSSLIVFLGCSNRIVDPQENNASNSWAKVAADLKKAVYLSGLKKPMVRS